MATISAHMRVSKYQDVRRNLKQIDLQKGKEYYQFPSSELAVFVALVRSELRRLISVIIALVGVADAVYIIKVEGVSVDDGGVSVLKVRFG